MPHQRPFLQGGRRHAYRVTVLAALAAAMGLVDLWLTLLFMRTTGMAELNPLAIRALDTGGAEQLVRFKLLTIAASSGLLYLARRTRTAAIGAWGAVAVLTALMGIWTAYAHRAADTAATAAAGTTIAVPWDAPQGVDPATWVYLGDDDP